MSAPSAAKVAPKSFNQIRNFSYIVVAWFGFMHGCTERTENDKLWAEYQQGIRKENAHRQELAHPKKKQSSGDVPNYVPEGLRDVYKSVAKQ